MKLTKKIQKLLKSREKTETKSVLEIKNNIELELYKLNPMLTISFLEEVKKKLMNERD